MHVSPSCSEAAGFHPSISIPFFPIPERSRSDVLLAQRMREYLQLRKYYKRRRGMNSFKCASRCVSAFPITSLKRPLSAACRRRRRRAGVHLRRPHLPSGEHFHFHLGRPLPPLPPRPVHGYGCVPVAESQLAIAGLRVSGWRRRREEKGGKEERATVRRAGAPLRRKRKGERKGKRKEKKKKQKKRRERKR